MGLKLPETFTTVTPLSKILAMVVFIVSPFVGFYFGIQYQKNSSIDLLGPDRVSLDRLDTGNKGEKLSPTPPAANKCHENDKYYIVVDDQIGNILIKPKKVPDQHFDCLYVKNARDYEIPNKGADWYFDLENDFLFIDTGTGPPPRGMTIFDLNKRRAIFSVDYNTPVVIENNHFDYWESTNSRVTNENCPSKKEWDKGGLGSVIEKHVRLDLSTLSKISLNETRCAPRQ